MKKLQPAAAEPRRSLREEQKEATRARILQASLDCFERQGVSETRFEEIAAAAGISRATLYLHFDNKDAVLMALLRDHLAGARDIYARLQAGDAASVREWLARHVRTLRRHRGAMRLFHVAGALDDGVGRLIDAHREALVDVLGARFPGFDLEAAAEPRVRRAAVILMLARVDHLLSAATAEPAPFDVDAAIDLVAAEFSALLQGE